MSLLVFSSSMKFTQEHSSLKLVQKDAEPSAMKLQDSQYWLHVAFGLKLLWV